ncbi:hypothetical protein U1Q18_008165 [Sarracenia purpurea var. burkii]
MKRHERLMNKMTVDEIRDLFGIHETTKQSVWECKRNKKIKGYLNGGGKTLSIGPSRPTEPSPIKTFTKKAMRQPRPNPNEDKETWRVWLGKDRQKPPNLNLVTCP